MLRVRLHGRGGQGAKVASRVLGTAVFLEGYQAQDFPLYGAERRGAPITAFTRISKEPILERGVIPEPDIVIVMDETLLDDPLANPLSGLGKEGILFVNTAHSAEGIKSKYKIEAVVLTLDITKISLDMIGKPVLSALAGGVASRITGLSKESLRSAINAELSDIITEQALIDKNLEASLYCFNAITPPGIKPHRDIHREGKVISMPFEPAAVSSPAVADAGNTPLRKTGNWRIFKPVWDYDLCTKCMTCVMKCPDSCIKVNEEGFPYTDYENCKGCMICAGECPAKAIAAEREVHAW